MSWETIKQKLSETMQASIIELDKLTDEQIKEVLLDYDKHIETELKKEKAEDRELFSDKYGGYIVALRFPTPEAKNRGIAADYKTTKNKSTQWWGPQIALLNNMICTVFFPEGFTPKKEFGWTTEATKEWLFIYRGTVKMEFKWLGESGYHKNEAKFIKEAKERFKDDTITSIADIRKDHWSEVDRVKYTFNPNQFLKLIK